MKLEIESCRDHLATLQATLTENQLKVSGMSEIVENSEQKSLLDLDNLCEKAVEEISTFKKVNKSQEPGFRRYLLCRLPFGLMYN